MEQKPEPKREADSFSTFLDIAQQIGQSHESAEQRSIPSSDEMPVRPPLIDLLTKLAPIPMTTLMRHSDRPLMEFTDEIRMLVETGIVDIQRDENLGEEVVNFTELGRLSIKAHLEGQTEEPAPPVEASLSEPVDPDLNSDPAETET